MSEEEQKNLITRPSSEFQENKTGAANILSRITSDALAVAKSTDRVPPPRPRPTFV
jgi:hypothetical protein